MSCKRCSFRVPAFGNMFKKNIVKKIPNQVSRAAKLELFGVNRMEVEVPGLPTFVAREFLTGLYIWQWHSLLWVWYHYYWAVACFNEILTFCAGTMNAHLLRGNQLEIQQLAQTEAEALLWRGEDPRGGKDGAGEGVAGEEEGVDDGVAQQRAEGTSRVAARSYHAGAPRRIPSARLVPGDVIVVEDNTVLTADCVLLKGQVVMQEAALTGEPMPVQKFPLPEEDHSLYPTREQHGKKHFLYSGTDVMQSNGGVALVVHTGAATQRGDLLKSILFKGSSSSSPAANGTTGELKFEFTDQMAMVYPLFCVLAALFTLWCVVGTGGLDSAELLKGLPMAIVEMFNIFSYVVNPLIAVGFNQAQKHSADRLKKGRWRVQCLELGRILMAGKLRVFCFDKTGTLTEDKLDFWGTVRMDLGSGMFGGMRSALRGLGGGSGGSYSQQENNPLAAGAGCTSGRGAPRGGKLDLMNVAIATCHTVTKLRGRGKEDHDEDDLVGNAVECEMAKFSRAQNGLDFDHGALGTVKFVIAGGAGEEIFRTIRQFEFDQHVQLQSCVVELGPKYFEIMETTKEKFGNNDEDETMILKSAKLLERGPPSSTTSALTSKSTHRRVIFTKGSFEKVAARCLGHTLPPNYETTTRQLASEGFYILGVAMKMLDEMNKNLQPRAELETGLTFLGLLLFKNELKVDSAAALAELKRGRIMPVMVTGDNMWTGLRIAEECGIVRSEKMSIFAADWDAGKKELVWELNLGREEEKRLEELLLGRSSAQQGGAPIAGDDNVGIDIASWASINPANEGEFCLEKALLGRMSLSSCTTTRFEEECRPLLAEEDGVAYGGARKPPSSSRTFSTHRGERCFPGRQKRSFLQKDRPAPKTRGSRFSENALTGDEDLFNSFKLKNAHRLGAGERRSRHSGGATLNDVFFSDAVVDDDPTAIEQKTSEGVVPGVAVVKGPDDFVMAKYRDVASALRLRGQERGNCSGVGAPPDDDEMASVAGSRGHAASSGRGTRSSKSTHTGPNGRSRAHTGAGINAGAGEEQGHPRPRSSLASSREDTSRIPEEILAKMRFADPFFALTQRAYDYLEANDPDLLQKIFGRILVFGRMTPLGKVRVVERWQEKGGMAGKW